MDDSGSRRVFQRFSKDIFEGALFRFGVRPLKFSNSENWRKFFLNNLLREFPPVL